MADPASVQVMSTYGKLKAFHPESENITTYLECVELYFLANGVPEAKQVPALLTSIGTKNYSLVQSLVAPAAPKDKTLEELETVLKAHFQPKPLVVAERFKFYRREQGPTESVLEYDAALRHLAITCDFGTFLDQALRDRFVCGLKSEQIQRSLLTEKDLTMARAVELAHAKESASKGAKDFKDPPAAGLNQLSGHSPAFTSQACHRCGKRDHSGQDCRFKCHKCGKQGHIASVCRSHKPAGRGTGRGRSHRGHRIKQFGVDPSSDEREQEDVGTFALKVASIDKSSKPIPSGRKWRS